jgi:predicted ribosome quality control (RQC) complex YloA/Tae2 family protein
MKLKYIYIPALKKTITFTIGQSATDNFAAIDAAKETDLWFHIGDNRSSAHIIADMPEDIERKDKKYIIKQGAVLCKQESRYKSEKNVSILYAPIKNIDKTKIPGTVIVTEDAGTTILI